MEKRKYVISLIVVLSLSLIIFVSAGAIVTSKAREGAKQTYKGILIDYHCSKTKDPTKHLKECTTMPNCEKSGYGIDMVQPNGSYKFYKFEAKGNNLVKVFLAKTKKIDNLTVEISGVLTGTAISVSKITEDTSAVTGKMVKEFVGILGDSDCSPTLKDPSGMTTKCMSCEMCETSGYGISIKQMDGKYIYYKFDSVGHKLAKENIVTKTKSKNVPVIILKGTLKDNVISVLSIAEK